MAKAKLEPLNSDEFHIRLDQELVKLLGWKEGEELQVEIPATRGVPTDYIIVHPKGEVKRG